MDAPFPFGLPAPTAFYLVLYLATLMVHIAFMNYVLAGSATLAVELALRRSKESPVSAILRDWMPFMLSAAITAGIAPLLFLLYWMWRVRLRGRLSGIIVAGRAA